MSEWVKSERQVERERVRRSRARRSASIATASTIVFIVLVVWGITSSPGWPRVRETFFDGEQFVAALPDVLEGFLLNVRIFLISEVLILVIGLLVALARGSGRRRSSPSEPWPRSTPTSSAACRRSW
ncbi:hypothetical protein ACFQ0B_11605 [Nonomuraea thailandensis]